MPKLPSGSAETSKGNGNIRRLEKSQKIRWERFKRYMHHLKQFHREITQFSQVATWEKIWKSGGFYENRSYKEAKVTEVYFNERDEFAEVYTHNTELKKRLIAYATRYPDLCYQTEDDEQGGLRFEIDKHRISIHLTPPYSKDRKQAASDYAKKHSKLMDNQ